MRRAYAVAVFAVSVLVSSSLSAQAPIALPNTMTTLGGTSPMTAATGTQCPNLPTGVLSTDALGDGCLAVNGIFGVGSYSGVVVDPFGNVLVNDDIKGVLHLINPTSGIMTLVAGGGTACSNKLDSSGDGCVAATGTPTAPITGARGVGIDPYGNVLLAGYGDHFVHIICRNASPLCVSGTPSPSATNPIQIQIGNMGLVAGCAYSGGSSGVTGAGVDSTPGFTIDGFSVAAFANAGGSSSACTTSLGEVDQPRGVTGDIYGNIYYADTASERLRVVLGPQSYNGVTNPLWAILEENSSWSTVKAGYVYTIANTATTATTAGSQTHCNGNTSNPSPYATDTHGDGCLFTSASVNSSSSDTQGVAVDAAGNVIFTDAGNGLLRVFYVSNGSNFASGTSGFTAGLAMQNAVTVNNSSYTGWSGANSPTAGFVYMLAGAGSGSGTGSVSTTPRLGYSTTSLSSGITKVTVSPQGNIFIGYGSTTAASNKVIFFDINSGYIRTLFATALANVTTGNFCSGSLGPISLSAYSDGCPASVSEFGGSSASGVLSIAADGLGNLYLYDGVSSSSGQLVRKVLAQGIAPQTLSASRQQTFRTHTYSATAATSSATLSATTDITAGSPACTLNGDNTVDCTVTVTSMPSAVGLRSATLTVSNASNGGNANVSLAGSVSGSALAFDDVSTTANNATTPVAPTTNAVFSGITPAGVATDGAGNVYAANGTSIIESIGGTAHTLSTASSTPIALPALPGQIAVDGLGDVFAASSSAGAIDELTVTGAGSPSAYSLIAIAYTPCSDCTAAPQAVATDAAGNVYVADVQSSPANTAIYKLTLTGGAVRQQATIATGFSNPVSLAVDPSGDIYVADKGADAVYKLAPSTTGAYTQTTLLSGVAPVGVTADAAGNIYVQDENSASILEVPLSGSETPVLTGLQSPVGVAVDGLGNVYDADAHNTGIVQVVRDAGSYGSNSTPLTNITGTLTNVGNLAATGTAQTAASAFAISATGCTIGSTSAIAVGEACPLSVALSSASLENPGTSYSDTLSFLATSSLGSVTFSDVVPAGPTSTALAGPASVLYAASGTEATFTVSVSGIASPSGSPVSITVSSVTLSGNAVVYSSTPALNASGVAMVSLSGLAPGQYAIAASYAGVTNTYSPSSASAGFTILQYVATGDPRTVTEPAIPGVCTVLNADLAMVNNDIPTSIDATVTNPDGARIQAALNSCSGTGQAVELSVGGSSNSAFLSGPLSMPSNVTLLVDPGVVLFFSRNVQDYDKTPGTHTCGTVNSSSATSSCLPLIDIPGSSSNVGIMGFGKLDGRGGDALINAFPASFAGQTWWGLSSIANGGGNQQNPRFIQMDSGSSGITLYKITLRNSPLFHISTTGAVSNFTAWDIKIITPTSSRNTDGIDPGNATNFTITRSWISDGDDNIAVGAAGSTAPAANISVTNNRFFAGHGESIGSYTQAGVSNVLFDSNMLSGNAVAGSGSSVNNTADSNSTGIRIKSGYDRGGVVTNIQYSNSCFQDHKAEIVYSPNYEATTGSASPNLENILMQNLTFLTAGTVQLTGTNNGVVYPLQLTLDNVGFPSTFPSSEFSPAPTNAALSYGPGQVSSDFVADYATFAGSNGNTVANNITETSLHPPTCSFTYIAPELTGPNGVTQTITEGQNATAVMILTPAVGGAAYPTGTVTLTDVLTSNSITVTLPGSTDTIFVPLTGLAPGTHTFTATYSGDSNYTLTAGQTVYSTTAPYVITVNAGSLSSTSTGLFGVPSTISYGSSFTAVATVTGSNPTGSVEFVVNGTVFASSYLSSGSASASITLPYSVNAYSLYAVYSGDGVNDGSTSATSSVSVTPALTTTSLSANTTTTTLGHPVALMATVSSAVGAPTGTVTFTYTTTGSGTPQATTATLAASSTPNASVATAGIDLPLGTDNVTATYTASGSFAGSVSTPMQFTVTQGTILPLPSNPIPLPYTMTTLAGGAHANCSAATDSYGDGCPATSIVFGGSVDLRSVAADPFGNVYLTDAVASVVRRIAPNGVISNFAGKVSGSACAPTGTTGCTPTQVSIDKARGISSDTQGNIYIAGYDSHAIYKVSVSDGLLYLVAGTGSAGSSGDGGPATSAQVNAPRGVWADTAGNVYIADTSNNKIRVVDPTGTIHTFAGSGAATSSGDGGLATAATIDNPQGVMTDANLNVYIADTLKIRVVCVTCGTGSPLDALLAALGIASPQNGYIYTVAGGGSSSGPYPTLATNVSMSPQKLAIDNSGDIYISDGTGAAWFLDGHTAYIRPIAGKTSSNCSAETDAFGDGCPATQAVIGDGGNGIGVGTDALGNLYISDTLNARIRKVTTGLASPATAVTSTAGQPVELHFIAGDSLAATNGLVNASSEWSLGTPACTTNSDSTADCLLTSSFTPEVPGARSSALTVNSTEGNVAYLGMTGTGLGSGATLDPATQTSFASNLAVTGLAADNVGNVYVSDANSKQVFLFAAASQSLGGSATGTALGAFQAPGAVAVDPRGYVYVADTSAGTVTAISPAGASSILPFAFTTPAGLAVDALNNLYVSDSSAKAVYQIDPITGAERTLPLGTLVAPAGLSIDPNGNLLVADPGAPAIDRFNLQTNGVTAVTTPAVAPSAALSDAAGNLLIADTADILAVPASSSSTSFTVATLAPASLAIDSAGDLYTGSAGGVLKLARTQGYVQFSTSEPPQTVDMLESGNQVFTGTSFGQTDTSDFSLAPTASTDCTLNSSGAGTLAIGGACVLTATYTPTTYSTATDTVTFNGNLTNAALSNPSSVELTLTGPATAPASTIALGAFSPVSPVYGQTVTLSATVSGTSVTPTGSVVFTVDSATYNATLSNGTATAQVSGLTAGSHQVSAAYTSTNGYASATTTPATTLVVAQATPTITWATPSAITYGTALSATQLDATSTIGGGFVYTPAAGTILGAGTQTLSMTFTPADGTDYTTATQTVQLQVNQATPAITWATPAAITYGTALSSTQLDATTTIGGNFVYTPAAGTVLGAGTKTLSVTFTPSDGTDYTTATQTVQLQVNQATPAITWATPAAITYGTALGSAQLNATSTVGGNFVYTPTAGTVLGAGTHTLSVTFTPTDTIDYTTATQTVQLQVNRATPAISWATPAAITYGTALSATQLDASTTIGGNLVYTPTAGTVLGAGTQTLSVTFTPADMTDYTTAIQTVQLTVNKASSSIALSANPNPGVQGKPETLTATVTGAGQPGGTIIFLSVATALCTSTLNGSGMATCTFTPSASGALSLSAQYQGDTNHTGSSTTLVLNVYDTAVTEQFSSTQLVYPGATNVTVCVAGATKATPTGTIQIEDGSTVLTTQTLGGNGCAYWYISPGLSAGSHTITSVYSGDHNNSPGTSDPTVLTVSPVPVNMSASCWNASFPYGGNYQCTVNVSSNAGSALGNITYSYNGGAPVSVALSGGNAGFTITKPPVGNQNVVIGYAQQTNYAAATPQTENFTVTAAPVQVSLTPSTWYTTVGTNITFSAAVTSWSAGAPNDTGAVSFYDGATLLATVPVNGSGQASYSTSSLKAGSQTITATYSGGATYATGSSSVTITLVP